MLREFAPFLRDSAASYCGTVPMNDNFPHCELPERMTMSDKLASTIEFAQEAMTIRLGYEVELFSLQPIDRNGKLNLFAFWRRRPPALYVVRDVA